MRKNLTISLSADDWEKVQSLVRELGTTYSGMFHELIEAGTGRAPDPKRVARYRALLAGNAGFLARRAKAFAKAGRRLRPST